MKLIGFYRERVPENSDFEKLLIEFGYFQFPMEVVEVDQTDDLGKNLVIGENCKYPASTDYFIIEK